MIQEYILEKLLDLMGDGHLQGIRSGSRTPQHVAPLSFEQLYYFIGFKKNSF